MIKVILSIILQISILSFAMYCLKLVIMHSTWFETSVYFQYVSSILFYIIPIIMILVILNKQVQFIFIFTLLCYTFILLYGFYFLGIQMIKSSNLYITIISILAMIATIIINCKIFITNQE